MGRSVGRVRSYKIIYILRMEPVNEELDEL